MIGCVCAEQGKTGQESATLVRAAICRLREADSLPYIYLRSDGRRDENDPMARKRKKTNIDRVAEELAAIGFARATDCLSVEDNALVLKSSGELTPEVGAAISSIERSSSGVKVKFYDKLKALELLGRYMGMFDGLQDRGEQEKNNLLEAILAATGKEVAVDDIPELQQATDPDDDMVEPTGS